jgi:phosphotransferase system HPr (HPr) family protein
MKQIKVVVPWEDGLHFRSAARLVSTAKCFRSEIILKCGEKVADLRSIVSVISLCATVGMALDLVASGEDEHEATRAIAWVFSMHGTDFADSMTAQNS